MERSFRTSLRRMSARAVMTAAAIVLVFGGVVAVFWLGVHAGQRGELTWGALFQFAFLSVFAASSVGALGEMWGVGPSRDRASRQPPEASRPG